MFFKPAITVRADDDGSVYDLYSDFHKEAFGCRPGQAQWDRYHEMSDEERRVEHATIAAWFLEEERIDAMRTEVAKFDFSRSMEYLMRRENYCERRAFQQVLRDRSTRAYPNDDTPSWASILDTADHYGWDYVAMDAKLPASLGDDLKRKWEELKAADELILSGGSTLAEILKGI